MNLTELTKWGLVRKKLVWVNSLYNMGSGFNIPKIGRFSPRFIKLYLKVTAKIWNLIWRYSCVSVGHNQLIKDIRFSEILFDLQEYVLMNIAWNTFKTFVGLSTLCSCSEAAHDKRWGDGDVLVQQEPGRDAVGCRRGRVEQGAGRGTTWEPCLVWCLSQLTPILTRNRLLIWKGNLTKLSDWVSLHISNAFCRLMEG